MFDQQPPRASSALLRADRRSPAPRSTPRSPRRGAAPLLLLFLGLGVGGCGPQDGATAATGETTAIPVQVEPVGQGTITRTLRRTGEVRAEVEVRVYSQVPDRILDLRVEEGNTVTREQVIAVIQSSGLSAGVAQAAASLESARVQRDKTQDDLERAERLLASNVASAAQVDALRRGLAAADAQVRSLQAVVEQASTRQAQSLVRAPISGLVGTRHLSRGDLASPQFPLVTLVQIDRVKVMLQATELDLPHLGVGTPVEIRVAALPDRVFPGAVTRVGSVLDPLTRHAPVEILLDNPNHELKPGMLAEVAVVLEQRQGVVTVPFFALTPEEQLEGRLPSKEEQRYHLFVVEGTTARHRFGRIGLLEGDRVELTEGATPGEVLVVRGQQLLDDGSTVEVIEDSPAATATATATATAPTAPPAATDGAAPAPAAPAAPPPPPATAGTPTAATPPAAAGEGTR
ncbi:MAG: efflux RND transporter periplasmic adaptor subunit [Myxococcota bacterium]|nr:efflux RND transporter periplasmic adaptor subunit [Myxococcota bacterium]